MSPRPTVADIQTYLAAVGWQRQPQTWRDASIWSHPDGYEVLVPPHDDLADTGLRVREILKVLAMVERRPIEEITGDINAPLADLQSYRTFPEDLTSGYVSLTAGLRGLRGVRDLLYTAARTVVADSPPTASGGTHRTVGDLLQHVQLGPSRPGSYIYTVRVPVDAAAQHLGRQVTRRLYESVSAVRAATVHTAANDLRAFDDTMTAGVSANLCEALSDLAGERREQPFEITFRWGRGLVSDLPAETIRFGTGTGRTLRAAAARLRERGVSGEASVTGMVESLHDQPAGSDRWRIKLRGELTALHGARIGRTVWVRLADQTAYDRAISAHRDRRPIHVQGELSTLHGRLELVAEDGDFDAPESTDHERNG